MPPPVSSQEVPGAPATAALRHLPPSAKVERGMTVFFLADECIKEYAVRANETSGTSRKHFDIVHQTATAPSALVPAAMMAESASGTLRSRRTGAAPFWVAVKTKGREAFELQLAGLRDPSWRKRTRDGEQTETTSSSSAASSATSSSSEPDE